MSYFTSLYPISASPVASNEVISLSIIEDTYLFGIFPQQHLDGWSILLVEIILTLTIILLTEAKSSDVVLFKGGFSAPPNQ